MNIMKDEVKKMEKKSRVVVEVASKPTMMDELVIMHIGSELVSICSDAVTDLNEYGDSGDWCMEVQVKLQRKVEN